MSFWYNRFFHQFDLMKLNILFLQAVKFILSTTNKGKEKIYQNRLHVCTNSTNFKESLKLNYDMSGNVSIIQLGHLILLILQMMLRYLLRCNNCYWIVKRTYYEINILCDVENNLLIKTLMTRNEINVSLFFRITMEIYLVFILSCFLEIM